LVLVAAVGCELPGITSDWRRIEPSVAADPFTLESLDGPPVALTALKGRVVVMEFWATWCGPCRFSLPSLELIAKRYRDRGVSVLLINNGEERDTIRTWAERRYTSPILIDEGGKIADRYGIQAIPRLFIADQAGRLVWTHQGYGGGLEHNLTLILDELLAATPG
jgi:thiol-disulfide isomerase/thioredoxin